MAKGKVLLVHTDLDILSKMYLALTHRNYKAEVCTNKEEIQQRIKRFKPAILVLGSDDYQSIKHRLKLPAVVINETNEKSIPLNDGDKELKKSFQVESLIHSVEELVY